MKKISLLSLCLMFFAMAFVGCAEHDLNYFIEGFKSEMPTDLGGGIQMTDIAVVDNYVQIESTSDETELDLGNSMINMILPAISDEMKAEFVDGADMKEFMQACSNEGKGFRMILKGVNSGNTVTMFEVTPEELNEKYPPKAKE